MKVVETEIEGVKGVGTDVGWLVSVSTEAAGRAEKGALCGMLACRDRKYLVGIDSVLLYQCLLYQ